MKTTAIFLMICLYGLGLVGAQNWQPLRVGEVYNYRYADSLTLSNMVWVDSVGVVGGDSVFYLNRICRPDHHDLKQTQYYVCNLPQFLQRKCIKRSDSVYLFEDTACFLLKPLAAVGDTWLLDTAQNLLATLTHIGLATLWGQQDSVKTITLSNGDSLLLSQSWGILRFPALYSQGSFSLVGIQNQGLGVLLPTWREIFDFEVGQQFCGESLHYKSPLNNTHTVITQKSTVLSKQSSPDTLHYHIKRQWSAHDLLNNSYVWGADTITAKYHAGLYDNFFEDFLPNSLQGMVGNVGGGISRVFARNGRTQLYRAQRDILGYLNPLHPSDTLVILPGNGFNQGGAVCYGAGIGRVFFEDWENGFDQLPYENMENDRLLAYIKGQDTLGSMCPDWLFTSVESAQTSAFGFHLYPNPAFDYIRLSCAKKNMLFSITDTKGRFLLPPTYTDTPQEIPVSHLTPGLYFVRVQDAEGNFHVEKFWKE